MDYFNNDFCIYLYIIDPLKDTVLIDMSNQYNEFYLWKGVSLIQELDYISLEEILSQLN